MGSIPNPFDQYRTELSSVTAVAEFFARPRFLSDITRNSALVIRGGRGTGKTTILKYISFDVQSLEFKKRELTTDLCGFLSGTRSLGVYYKLNTSSFSLMKGYGLEEDRWMLFFGHYFNLLLVQKVWDVFVRLILERAVTASDGIIGAVCERAAASFQLDCPHTLDAVAKELRHEQVKVESFVTELAFSAPERPFNLTLPGEPIFSICDALTSFIPELKGVVFHILLDEFENLLDYQQKIVNTLIKHTHHPVFFKVAGRYYGFRTNETIHPHERIEEGQDYVSLDIEKVLSKSPKAYLRLLREIGTKRLQAIPFFREHGLVNIERILTPLTLEAEARMACGNKPRVQRQKMANRLPPGFAPTRLFSDDNPLLERFNYALLCRGRDPEVIEEGFQAYQRGTQSEAAKWYHKAFKKAQPNLILQILRDERGGRKRYAGFETLAHLSSGIVRNFIELCYRSFQYAIDEYDVNEEEFRVSPDHQTEAVWSLSESLYNRIGTDIEVVGPSVKALFRQLGIFFKYINLEDEAVSKPSRSYFSTFKDSLDEEIKGFLQSAVLHSFLFEKIGWKGNRIEQPRPDDYVFNRLLTPFFEMPSMVSDRTLLTKDDLKAIQQGQTVAVASKFVKKPPQVRIQMRLEDLD